MPSVATGWAVHGAEPGRRTIRPARAVCRLMMAINGTDYQVNPNPAGAYAALKAYRLSKADGTAYDVAQTVHGLSCDCPDFIFHRDGIDRHFSQHLAAVDVKALTRALEKISAHARPLRPGRIRA